VSKAPLAAGLRMDDELTRLDEELVAHHLEGHWNLGANALQPEPAPWAAPYLWRWADIRRLLVQAGEMRGIEGGAGRRTVRLCTPGNKTPWTTPTIHASVQLVKPGEVAGAHRHTMGAFRFVVEGKGGYTTVEGERLSMEPADLILTPPWAWHDHGHDDGKPTIWIDVHDYPFTSHLGAIFFEPFKQAQQPVLAPGARGEAMRMPFTYKGSEHVRQVTEGAPEINDDAALGATLDYVNAATGGVTLPTMTCHLHRLTAGAALGAFRETANRIYHVVSGRGRTQAGDTTLAWETGDIFVMPGWTWHRHTADADAVLFSVSDEPIFDAFGLARRDDKPSL
jgi:gentisate 1,2-dioxygenase